MADNLHTENRSQVDTALRHVKVTATTYTLNPWEYDCTVAGTANTTITLPPPGQVATQSFTIGLLSGTGITGTIDAGSFTLSLLSGTVPTATVDSAAGFTLRSNGLEYAVEGATKIARSN